MDKCVPQPETKGNFEMSFWVSQKNIFPQKMLLIQFCYTQQLQHSKVKTKGSHHHFWGTSTYFVSGAKLNSFSLILMPNMELPHPNCIYLIFSNFFKSSVRCQDHIFPSLLEGKKEVSVSWVNHGLYPVSDKLARSAGYQKNQ